MGGTSLSFADCVFLRVGNEIVRSRVMLAHYCMALAGGW